VEHVARGFEEGANVVSGTSSIPMPPAFLRPLARLFFYRISKRDAFRKGLLINNASAPHGSDKLDEWSDALETDLLGAIHATRWAIEAMRRGGGGGAIVNIANFCAVARPQNAGWASWIRCRKGRHDPHDDSTGVARENRWNPRKLPGAWLDCGRWPAPVLGVSDTIGACPARAVSAIDD
jgi:NAD(P)-dependent dehydrogenase (short-subunit alcohol dehydrogenase family)